MTRTQAFFLTAVSALALAACASSETDEASRQDERAAASSGPTEPGRDQVVVSGSRLAQDGSTAQQYAYAPPAPPPPVVMAAPKMVAPGTAVVAQLMPGDINRENYEDVEINGVKVVAKEPVSTFSIDVDTAS